MINRDANYSLFEFNQSRDSQIICSPFIDNFVFMGGGGAALGLILVIGKLVLLKRSSKQLLILAPVLNGHTTNLAKVTDLVSLVDAPIISGFMTTNSISGLIFTNC